MRFELSGILKSIGQTQVFDSGFAKKSFIINTGGEYAKDISFELHGDNVSKIDLFQAGADVVVYFNIKQREHETRIYTTLVAWKIE